MKLRAAGSWWKRPRPPWATPGRPLLLSRENLERPIVRQRLLMAVASLLIAALATPALRFQGKIPSVGEVATQDIKSPGAFLIEDVESTRAKRKEAENAVRAVYDLDAGASAEADARVAAAFASARRDLPVPAPAAPRARKGRAVRPPKPAPAVESPARRVVIDRFREALGPDVPKASFDFLASRGAPAADEEAVRAMVRSAMRARIVSNRELLQDEARKGIVVRRVGTRQESVVKDLSAIDDLDHVRLRIREEAERSLGDEPPGRREHLVRAAQALVRPTLTFNRNETEERRARAREGVRPVTIGLKKGEIVARDGDPIDARHVMIMEAIRNQSLRSSAGGSFVGVALLLFLAMLLLDAFARGGVRKYKSDTRSVAFFLGLLVLSALVTRVSLFVADTVGAAIPVVEPDIWRVAIPVAAGAMLARLVLNSETAIFFAILFTIVAEMIVERSVFFGLFTLIGSVVGAQAVGQAQARSKLLMAGAKVGMANAALVILWALMDGQFWTQELLVGALAGVFGGLGAAILVIGCTPVAEWASGAVTGMRLLELANRDQPLLRELAVRAPGTYHHSMIMANLVEAAAEAIQANPLLARVSAYYHDIGKMLKPQYYVENMSPGENRHDRLSPSMSALIVQAHVKDGIELARQYKLPQVIIDAIPQHHGTSLIKYFFDKAIESSDPELRAVKEEDYRYPGPRPQSRECGLLMLADSTEAGLRTLSDPNPARIRGAVQKIINNIFRDGQLDECDLTLRDLDAIARSFSETLSAIYHSRIEYPEPVAKGDAGRRKRGDEGPTDRPAEAGKDKPKRGGEAPKDVLKRLGMP